MLRNLYRYFRLRSIFSRFFFWFFMIATLTSFLYLITYIVVDKNNRLAQAEEEMLNNLRNQQLVIENWIRDRREEVRLLTNLPMTKEANLKDMAERFQTYSDNYTQLNALVFIDRDGYVRIDTANPDVYTKKIDAILTERNYFQEAVRGKEAIEARLAPTENEDPVLIFSSPVKSNEGTFNGVVFSAVYVTKMNDLVQKALTYDTGRTFLLSDAGDVLIDVTQERKMNEAKTWSQEKLSELFESETAIDMYKNDENERILRAYTPLVNGKFLLVNEINEREILAPHVQMVRMMLTITIGIMIIVILIAIPLSKRILRPFYLLLDGFKRMRDGNVHARLEEKDFASSPLELQQMMRGFNEMAEAVALNKRHLQRLSLTDGLTNIANRRLFEQQLAEEWERAKRDNKEISLIFFDIDHFKQFNDLFGHQAGDRCLQLIAKIVEKEMEAIGYTLARYGGEEFVVVLPNTNEKDAVKVANIVRERVKALKIQRVKNPRDKVTDDELDPFQHVPQQYMSDTTTIVGKESLQQEDVANMDIFNTKTERTFVSDDERAEENIVTRKIHLANENKQQLYDEEAVDYPIVTVSVGVGVLRPRKNDVKETLIQLADQAVYEAKSTGRDRIVIKKRPND